MTTETIKGTSPGKQLVNTFSNPYFIILFVATLIVWLFMHNMQIALWGPMIYLGYRTLGNIKVTMQTGDFEYEWTGIANIDLWMNKIICSTKAWMSILGLALSFISMDWTSFALVAGGWLASMGVSTTIVNQVTSAESMALVAQFRESLNKANQSSGSVSAYVPVTINQTPVIPANSTIPDPSVTVSLPATEVKPTEQEVVGPGDTGPYWPFNAAEFFSNLLSKLDIFEKYAKVKNLIYTYNGFNLTGISQEQRIPAAKALISKCILLADDVFKSVFSEAAGVTPPLPPDVATSEASKKYRSMLMDKIPGCQYLTPDQNLLIDDYAQLYKALETVSAKDATTVQWFGSNGFVRIKTVSDLING